jgi:quinoprotein dehydrogenase-associated probable ABC transporter substrate-binding protein
LIVLVGTPAHAQDCPAPAQDLVRVPSETASPGPEAKRVLRISADPNNLPFTNRRLEGFENRIAAVVARELKADLQYLWRAQRRGFFRSALEEGECDLVLGVPAGFERALTTVPYYRSSYVFVTRPDRRIQVRSLDDPALRGLKIGVQLIGDDGFNTPPAHALAARHLVDNLVGFTVYGDYTQENPPARIIDAVRKGDVDIGIAWGPLAGYFARRAGGELAIVPVAPEIDRTGLPLAFDIAMGVRKGDKVLRDQLNEVLERRRDEIGRILDEYGIPRASTLRTRASK